MAKALFPPQLSWLFMGLLVGVQGLDCECISVPIYPSKHSSPNTLGHRLTILVGSVSPFSLDYKPQIVMIGPEQVSAHRSLLWKVGELPLPLHSNIIYANVQTYTCTMLTRRGCIRIRTDNSGDAARDHPELDLPARLTGMHIDHRPCVHRVARWSVQHQFQQQLE